MLKMVKVVKSGEALSHFENFWCSSEEDFSESEFQFWLLLKYQAGRKSGWLFASAAVASASLALALAHLPKACLWVRSLWAAFELSRLPGWPKG